MMNKLYLKILIVSIAIVAFVFSSCNKEEKLVDLISGSYKLQFASIDGEDVTDYLLNDTVNLTYLRAGNVDGGYLFYIYFDPSNDYDRIYTSQYSIINEKTLTVRNNSIEGDLPLSIENNIAFQAFSKQDRFILNLETLTDDLLTFNTIYSGKKYRYEFKE